MKRGTFERRFPKIDRRQLADEDVVYDRAITCESMPDMDLSPGGRMRQQIFKDPYRLRDWEEDHFSGCFVQIANSLAWRAITGQQPPTIPPTAEEYARRGLPWFEYYDEHAKALTGTEELSGLESVADLGKKKGDVPLPENESVDPTNVIELRRGLKQGQVREGRF